MIQQTSPQSFYNKALKKGKGGINAFAVTCQSYLETGGYTSELCKKAENYAGIKRWSGHMAPVYAVNSYEEVNGVHVIRKSDFAKYLNVDDFLDGYEKKIKNGYPLCIQRSENFIGYFTGLLNGKWGAWATDSSYFKKLLKVSLHLAPQIFGEAWRTKLRDAADYAMWHDYLGESHIQDIKGVYGDIWIPRDQVTATMPKDEETGQFKSPEGSSAPTATVWIDAGHGGKDPGAKCDMTWSEDGVVESIKEKDLALRMAQACAEYLADHNVVPVLTRQRDSYILLQERTDAINAEDDIACVISIHCNAFTDPNIHGLEVYTYNKDKESTKNKKSVKLAKTVEKEILRDFHILSGRNPVQRTANFHMVREPKFPAVLVEAGYLSNPQDAKVLVEYAEEIGRSIAFGVIQYLEGQAKL